MGAAGAVEIIISLTAFKNGLYPPSVEIAEKDKEFDNVNIITVSQKLKTRENIIALKNSFGFGGTNASLCIGTHE